MSFLTRSKIIHAAAFLWVPILFLFHPSSALCEQKMDKALKPDKELEEELKYLKAETYVITPSRIPQRIEKAPGAIYVVTDRQIRQMGARNLADVIRTVPGWHVWYYWGGFYLVTGRALMGPHSSRILFLVNGHVMNDPWWGSGIDRLPQLELDNVKRIEFVNGGLSSVYGANAYAGVINVITKKAKDIEGLELTARGGSYDTYEANALFGKTFKGLEVAAYLNYFSTNGFEGWIETDQQSLLDQRFGTNASLAPGYTKGDMDQWHAHLTLKYKGLEFDGKYIWRQRELPFSWRPVLDRISNDESEEYYLKLSYEFTPLEGLDLVGRVYTNQYRWEAMTQFYPKGSLVATPTIWPGWRILSEDKFINDGVKNSRIGGEVQATYEITDSNTLVAGVAYEEMKVWDNRGKANYVPITGGIIPLSSVRDLPAELYIKGTKKRNFKSVYAEDIWDITDDLRLTIGGRYDHYSDFGGAFSPRVGLNWEFLKNYHVKLLYGRSFRSPSFTDLYSPGGIGNPDLEPETRQGYSLSFGARFLPHFSGRVSLFYGSAEDLIVAHSSVDPTRINSGTARHRGVELELKYDFGRGTYLAANYTYLHIKLRNPVVYTWFEPQHLGTLMANIRLNKYLNFNCYLLYRGDWSRQDPLDPRDDPSDYVIVNATLIAKNFLKGFEGLELRGSVHNLFDKDYTSPAHWMQLPDDTPMPGINFFLEARYRFDLGL
jgi:iron complex outermembrane receptor protein